MVWIRLAVSTVIFAIFWQLWDYTVPLFSWATNLLAVLTLSWFIGRHLTRLYILPRLPPVNPKGKAVLVTGCDTGFGHLTALELNKLGYHVFAGCLIPDGDGAKDLKKKAVKKHALTVLKLDVTKEEDITAANEVVKNFLSDSSNGVSDLHSIVNNAGIMFTGSIEMFDAGKVDDFLKMMDVNCYGMIRVTRMFLPLIRKSKGRIVNVTSSVVNLAIGATGAYSVTKAAAAKFTEMLQTELGRMGVKTIAIEPWIVKTNLIVGEQLLGSFKRYWSDHTSEEVKTSYGEAWYQKMLTLNQALIDFPYNSTPDMVVTAMVDGVHSPEPQTVYRVTNPIFDWVLWIVNEWPSWELRELFRWLFDLLLEKTL